MTQPVVQGLITFAGGAAVSALVALLSAAVIRRKPSVYGSFSAVRQLFSVGYLVGVFFVSRSLGWDVTAPLLGAAFGLTGFSMLFAVLLARYSNKISKSAAADKKGEDQNG